jgi:DNA-dependent RNA polymerase auxiliary subunit epsilon
LLRKNISLRKQFLTRIIAILLVISLLSAGIQLYTMNKQIDYEINTQTAIIAQSVNKGIEETDLAAKSIEHQIDLKMEGYLKHIGFMLDKKKYEDITEEELLEIKDELGLSGLSILAKKDNDIVVVKSTNPKEIGWSSRKVGDWIYENFIQILDHKAIEVEGVYSAEGLVVMPVVKSEVYNEEDLFFKYGYYHSKGTNYIIDPFIEADEIYKFTENVGPESWISQMEKENPFVMDISVLDPNVFQNPELESKYWPPVKKVVYGDYQYQSEQDLKVITGMIDSPSKKTVREKLNKEKILKLFLPQENGQVIHIALDYGKMTEPLVTQSIILGGTGIAAIVSLFLLIYGLFNKIYDSIRKIRDQISLLENGDLTAQSKVHDGSELASLSESVNNMASKLNYLVNETRKQAIKTMELSVQLEDEASSSVETIYELSTETTIKARDQLYEIMEFIDKTEGALAPYEQEEDVQKVIGKLERMRDIAKERTSATTDTTITLSDLLKSLYGQSSELSEISSILFEQISQFKLDKQGGR